MNARNRSKLASIGLVAAGLTGGAALGVTGVASAADSTPTPSASSTAKPAHVAETPLTGDTLAKVKAAVSAKYPGATFDRVETDGDGVYEAHITTKAGDKVTVEVDKAFAVTGTEAKGAGGGGRGHGHGGGKGGGSGETALTGDTLAKVKAAVSAKYPGATFDRVETDSDGVYEAHITTKAGDKVTVEVDKAFAVTGTETHK
jgi:uncharacterized membrane protein YkoI